MVKLDLKFERKLQRALERYAVRIDYLDKEFTDSILVLKEKILEKFNDIKNKNSKMNIYEWFEFS